MNYALASSVNCGLSLPDRGEPVEVKKMAICNGKEISEIDEIYCGRCDKIVGDVQADLVAEFGIRGSAA